MKKTRFLALALVVAIALMGAGYAWWTDTLKIESTVKTGTFDVDFIRLDKEGRVIEGTDGLGEITVDSNITTYDSHEADNGWDRDKVVINISNLYPKAKVTRTITLKNVGTIGARINEVKLFSLDTEYPTGARESSIMLKNMNVAIVTEDGGRGEFPKLTGTDTYTDIDFILAPQQEVSFDIEFELDKDAPNTTTEGKTVTYELTIDFEQFNYEDPQ